LVAAPPARPTSDELDDLRAHVRAVIAEHAPPFAAREGRRAPETAVEERQLREWFRVLYAEGLAGGDWPVEHGGRPGHHPLHDRIVIEEILRARAPRPVDQVGLASHVLLHFGTSEQKHHYLPLVRQGEHIWCQLLSEPDAGSDIAAVRARGGRRPDGSWVLNGQKTWTTDAHWADMGLALIRTDPDSDRHRGLTMFIVPMRSPGVEVRPIRTIVGAADINEVFLDDVVLSPDHIVGDVGDGWAVIMTGLDFERFGIGGNVVLLEMLLEDILTVARDLIIDGEPAIAAADVRQRIAALAVEVEVALAVVDDHVEHLVAGQERDGDAAIAKISFTETYNRLAAYGTEIAASGVVNDVSGAKAARDRVQEWWLWSRAYTISGGSSEMMRNILAKRRLHLPSAPRR